MHKLPLKVMAASAWLIVTGCGPDSSGVATAISAAVDPPAPTPTPSASPAAAPTSVAALSLEGAAALRANFDIQDGLQPSWGTGVIPEAYDHYEGAFRFTCGGATDVAYDDPIFFPGQPGKSHLHQPWGNSAFNANTTPDSLSKSAETYTNQPSYRIAAVIGEYR